MLARTVSPHLTKDSDTDVFNMTAMAWGMRRAGVTDAVTLPGSNSTEGGVSYVIREEPAATEAFATRLPLPGS
jgi:hypothetical protein